MFSAIFVSGAVLILVWPQTQFRVFHSGMLQFVFRYTAVGGALDVTCADLTEYEGNSCFDRYEDYSAEAVTFEKSSTMAGSDDALRNCRMFMWHPW